MEFVIVMWDPHITSNKSPIEKMQCRFLSFAVYLLKIEHRTYDYEPALKKLNIQFLADRRVTANRVFPRKLVEGSIV